jgi:hypothetical protein
VLYNAQTHLVPLLNCLLFVRKLLNFFFQAFHVLYHTDNNVLLGAPTGSGKTISAELAMLHLFNTQPDMKVCLLSSKKCETFFFFWGGGGACWGF